MSGYDVDRFPNLSPTERSEYTCSICQDIFRCPMTAPCCLQTFCEHCIGNWLQTNNTCPYDRKTLNANQLSRPARAFVNIIGKLKIKCDFQDKGCKEVVNLDDLTQHTNKCGYNPENYGKKCEICLCNQKSGHDCIKSLLELNRKANEENQSLKSRLQTKGTPVRPAPVPPIQSTSILSSSAGLASSSPDQSLMREINELKTEKMNFMKTIQDLTNSAATPTHPITNYEEPNALESEDKLMMVSIFEFALDNDYEDLSLAVYIVAKLMFDLSWIKER